MKITPLFKLLEARPYPIRQTMDAESVAWLYIQLAPHNVHIGDIVKNYHSYKMPSLDTIAKNFNAANVSGIHGYTHGLRVSVYCWVIIQYLKVEQHLTLKQISDLLRAAIYHDIGRLNDNSDPDHGIRSAQWLDTMFPEMSRVVKNAVALHSQEGISTLVSNDEKLLLMILKSADALDRYRLPNNSWWPDYKKVPLDISKLDSFAKTVTYTIEKIVLESESTQNANKEIELWLAVQAI